MIRWMPLKILGLLQFQALSQRHGLGQGREPAVTHQAQVGHDRTGQREAGTFQAQHLQRAAADPGSRQSLREQAHQIIAWAHHRRPNR